MNPIPFLPRDATPCPLPDWVLAQLSDTQAQSARGDCPDPVKALMESALAASGLDGGDLPELVAREVPYDPKSGLIGRALLGECEDLSLQQCINRILKVSDTQWREALELRKSRIRAAEEDTYRIRAHQEYTKKGPFLRILKDRSTRIIPTEARTYVGLRDQTIDMHGDAGFDPPSAEAMGRMIASFPELCASRILIERNLVGGFRYHRLPDEMATYDREGNLYASGDVHIPDPPGTSF